MIAIGSDHRGYALKEELKKYFDEKAIPYKDFGILQTPLYFMLLMKQS